MKCHTYIFQLTSGQLKEAGWLGQLQATQHRLICRHCRAFTHNDARLENILQNYRAALTQSNGTDETKSL
ncbi:MAG TPA: hypothetical protein VFY31_07655 [Macromonas sp.]|nr:hypothetical protein [Macromonas sp.]